MSNTPSNRVLLVSQDTASVTFKDRDALEIVRGSLCTGQAHRLSDKDIAALRRTQALIDEGVVEFAAKVGVA